MKSFLCIYVPVLLGGLLGEIPQIKRFFDRIEDRIKKIMQNAAEYASQL